MIYNDQLDVFRAFKQDGAIPKNADPTKYRIQWGTVGPYDDYNMVTVWRTGLYVPSRSKYFLYERPIASMKRHCVWC